MSVMDILRWPDAQLSTICAPVSDITPEIATLADAMLETMYAAPGRGLAAPQVGVLRRMFVMDATWKDGEKSPLVFINPEIVEVSETYVSSAEGCLSLPGISADVSRPDAVRMRWTDRSGAAQEETFCGFPAACVQHELDHLNGIVTLDRLDAETRARVLNAYNTVAT